MVTNYLKVAIRSLLRNKGYATINVVGLAVGIAASLLLFLVIQFELSFESFHRNRDRIYRLVSVSHSSEGIHYTAGVPFPVANGLREEFPQLQKVAAIYGVENALVTVGEPGERSAIKRFNEERGMFYVEPEFFEIFDFPWLAGDPGRVLRDPNSAALSEETAEKYFGDWHAALGKTFRYRKDVTFTVAGIFKNVPTNTDFPMKIVVSYASFENRNAEMFKDWVSIFGQNYCFVMLPPGSGAAALENFLPSFVKRHKPPEYVKNELRIQPVSEMHFDSRFGNYGGRTTSKELIGALALIGMFLLMIACVNFINLATAQAVNRSREVGVRKVLGSSRLQLSMQFIGETGLLTAVSVIVASGITELVVPYLRGLLGIPVEFALTHGPGVAIFLVGVTCSVTLLSGFYPALILSGFNPVAAIKNSTSQRIAGRLGLRRGLVVLQFAIAQVLIIGMLIVVSQMEYLRSAPLGFDKDGVLLVPVSNDSLDLPKLNVLKSRLSARAGILDVSFSAFTPIDDSHWTSDFTFDNSGKSTDFEADLKWADPEFFKTYNVRFVAGMVYSPSDTVRGFVVSEMLLKELGIRNPEEGLGKNISFWKGQIVAPIVGVVRDFHSRSLVRPLAPMVFGAWKAEYQVANIKLDIRDSDDILRYVKTVWEETYPDRVFESRFLDQKIEGFYRDQTKLSQLTKIFAALAIFISCLGLYGLVSFMAARRTKEVGIRRVLGASVGNIVQLFSLEFTALTGIAFLIAAPVSYFTMQGWLEDFAFRIDPGAGTFILALLGSAFLAWCTVGYRALRAAMVNPAKSLRYE